MFAQIELKKMNINVRVIFYSLKRKTKKFLSKLNYLFNSAIDFPVS